MKKSLVAMAVLAATGAFAQSSVTLYGRMDLGTSMGKVETTTPGVLGGPSTTNTIKTTSLAGAENVWTGSRLGVRGSEDLGGGLKANFQYEFRLAPDAVSGSATAAPNTVLGSNFGRTRLALLQLAGDFGSVTIGTYLNPFDDIRYAAGTGGVAGGTLLEDYLGGGPSGASAAGGLAGRSVNAIGYRSPVFAGGFTASIGTVYEKAENPAAVLPALGVTRGAGYIASIGYANGPVNVLAAYGTSRLKGATGTTTITDTKNTDYAVKASYDLGVARPFVMFERTKSDALGTANDNNGRGFELGSTFPMGAFTPYVTLGQVRTQIAGIKAKTNGVQFGTQYALSKRTFVYGAIGNEKTNNTVATTGVGTSNVKGSGYAIGLVHNF